MENRISQLKKYWAEAIGTFTLVFIGTGAIVVNDVSEMDVTHVGISLAFGLVVMSMIYSIGDISGAHINPAVTIAFWVAGRLEGKLVIPYVVAQFVGALAASCLLRVLFLEHTNLGATIPAGFWWQSFILEVVLTFILMFVILNVSTGAKEKGIMAGTAIGGVVAFEAIVGGPISGASMNPARSLGPAIISGQLSYCWIYVLAPVIGAFLAVGGCRCIQGSDCCSIDEISDGNSDC